MQCTWVKRAFSWPSLCTYCVPPVTSTDTTPPIYLPSPAPCIAAKRPGTPQFVLQERERNGESGIRSSLFPTGRAIYFIFTAALGIRSAEQQQWEEGTCPACPALDILQPKQMTLLWDKTSSLIFQIDLSGRFSEHTRVLQV